MARRWTKTAFPNNQYGSLLDLPAVTTQLSLVYYYKAATLPGGIGSDDRHMILQKSASTVRFNYYVMHSDTALNFGWTDADSSYRNQSGAYTWDTDEHLVCVSMDWTNNQIFMWVDGTPLTVTPSGLTTNPQTGPSMTNRFIGIQANSTDDLDGTLAEYAIWTDYVLTQDDVDTYNNRISPDHIAPEKLFAYWELSGYNSITVTSIPRELDPINGNWLLLNGGVSLADHPRFYHIGNVQEDFDDSLLVVVGTNAQLITCM